MKTFDDFLREAKQEKVTGNYVAISTTMKEFEDIELPNGAVFTKEPHMTLMYSTESSVPHEKIIDALKKFNTMKGKVTGIGVFGKPEDQNRAVVLKIDCDDAVKCHEKLKKLGMTHSFSEFSPHLTYAYKVDEKDAEEFAKKLEKAIGTEFEFSDIIAQEIDEDWINK